MDKVTTIGLDLAKTYFQVPGVDERGRAVVQRRLRRSEVLVFSRKLSPCLVGMGACATAHHWRVNCSSWVMMSDSRRHTWSPANRRLLAGAVKARESFADHLMAFPGGDLPRATIAPRDVDF